MWSENLKAVIRPLHLTSKYFGLAPLNFENASSYTPFLIAFLAFATGLITVGVTFESQDQENYDIIGLTLRAEFYLSCVLMGVNIFIAGYRQDSLKLFLREIENVDHLFQKQRIKVDYLKAKQWAWLQVIGNLVIFMALQGITVLEIQFVSTYFLVYFAVTINKFLNTIVILQFTNGVLLLWQRFKWMNTKIESLQAKLGAEVVEFSKIHDKLCDIAKLLNGIYSIQLLMSMAVRFMLIIAQLIKIYKIFIQGAVGENLLPLMTGLFGFMLQVVTIFLLTWACSITANEARRTAIILHKIWDASETLKIQVKYFSLQMHHQNVKFTACGYFDIDFTVIYGIIGAVTTYLIIVIQFDLSRQESEGNCQ